MLNRLKVTHECDRRTDRQDIYSLVAHVIYASLHYVALQPITQRTVIYQGNKDGHIVELPAFK